MLAEISSIWRDELSKRISKDNNPIFVMLSTNTGSENETPGLTTVEPTITVSFEYALANTDSNNIDKAILMKIKPIFLHFSVPLGNMLFPQSILKGG
ncbi:hypothetical protein V7O61_12015 [Methanolobus sp. WCC1]|jgi:hypothetical protein|uniref:hypothetical protein n=1 Tax=unclassified Methanolobus TaxID=2629569 RepID=UPI003251A671